MDELSSRFFDAHIDDHPEEASTLGLWQYAGRLSDPSRASVERELARLRPVLAQAERRLDGPSIAIAERLDLDALVRFAKHRVRYIEQDYDAHDLELATVPNSALQHAALHARSIEDVERVAARARETKRFLEAHAENLRRGARDGRGPDAGSVAAYVERVLPGAAESCAALTKDVAARMKAAGVDASGALAELEEASAVAASAYRAMANVVRDEIAPRARPSLALGEAEVAFRLRDVMGLDTSVADLFAFGRAKLEEAHATLLERIRRSGLAAPKTVADAGPSILATFAPKTATLEEALAMYGRHTDDAIRFIEERDLLPLPKPLAYTLTPLPGGIADGGTLTNWPAPLLDPHGHGHALYATDPSAHSTVVARNLSVHEGIPGHYLQSVVWQRSKQSPVRFLGITDDIAGSRQYFGTMMNVEGWAVHTEHLFREEGFFPEEDHLEWIFYAWVSVYHAVRVLMDLHMHCGGMSDDDATRFVVDASQMPERWCRMQVLRARRIPLQHLTYLVGSWEIERLRERALAKGTSKRAFYGKLLELGPVPPSRLVDVFG